LDAEEDDFFITAISDRRYTTNCTHAYQIEMMFPCLGTKVYESKGDQYLVVLWPPFGGCSGLVAPMPWDFEGIVHGVFDRGKNKSEFQYLDTKLHTAQKDCIPPKPPWAVVDDLTVNTMGITCNSICVSFLVVCIQLGKLAPCHKLLLSVDFLSTISKNSNGLIDKQPKPPWISYYEVVKPWMSEVFYASL
jgi:hypothetical protein